MAYKDAGRRRQKKREYYRKHAESIRAKAREYYHKHHERSLGYGAKYRSAHKEQYKEARRIWRANNLERILFLSARSRALRRGVPFSITMTDIKIPSVCPILLIPLARIAGHRAETAPSLDCIVPEKGYVPGNIAVISNRANRIKNDGTPAEHRRIADWVEHHIGGQ